jgi:hypothetical protein
LQLQLVGLSVFDTARKLKMHCRNDALYDNFVKDFLPVPHGRSAQAQRCSRARFAIECDVLAAKQQFEQLLTKAEMVRTLRFRHDFFQSVGLKLGAEGLILLEVLK